MNRGESLDSLSLHPAAEFMQKMVISNFILLFFGGIG